MSQLRKIQGRQALQYLARARKYPNSLIDIFNTLVGPNGHGDQILLEVGSLKIFLMSHPDDLYQLLALKGKSFERPAHIREAFTFAGGQNTFSTIGEDWHKQRKKFVPYMRKHELIMDHTAAINVIEKHLDKWSDKTQINLAEELAMLALKYLCQALFHYDLSDNDALRIHQATDMRQHILYQQAMRLPVDPNMEATANATYRAILDKLIRFGKPSRDGGTQNLLCDILQYYDFIDHPSQDTQNQIYAELSELLFAGHETLKNTLFWAFYHLAQRPDLQEQMAQEARERGLPLDIYPRHHLPMRLSKQIMQESMRLHPSAFMLVRQAIQDTDINGVKMSKGDFVVIPTITIHRDERWYPDAQNFDPQHFAPQTFTTRPRFSFLPFGRGAISCPGRGMALQEGCLILSAITQRFALALPPKQPSPQTQLRMFMMPDSKTKLRIKQRKLQLKTAPRLAP